MNKEKVKIVLTIIILMIIMLFIVGLGQIEILKRLDLIEEKDSTKVEYNDSTCPNCGCDKIIGEDFRIFMETAFDKCNLWNTPVKYYEKVYCANCKMARLIRSDEITTFEMLIEKSKNEDK